VALSDALPVVSHGTNTLENCFSMKNNFSASTSVSTAVNMDVDSEANDVEIVVPRHATRVTPTQNVSGYKHAKETQVHFGKISES